MGEGDYYAEHEVWRKIPDWPYEVSDMGRVRRAVDSPTGSYRAGYVLSPVTSGQDDAPNGSRYQRVQLNKNGESRRFAVHQLVLSVFVGECPVGHEADHINRCRDDNRLSNLRYLPTKLNRLGPGGGRGESNNRAVLSQEDVREIRQRLAAGDETQSEIASDYGVSRSNIAMIATGRVWKNAAD